MKYNRGDLLKDIAKSSVYGNLGLFIGAGMSKAVMNGDYKNLALSWGELLEKCISELKIDVNLLEFEGLSYPSQASVMVDILSQQCHKKYDVALREMKEKISELTCWYPSKEQRERYLPILEKINPKWIITTNYDLILDSILTGKSVTLGPEDTLTSPNGLIPIFHLHGIRTNPASIVITQEDYISLFRPNEYRQQKLPLLLKESTTVFIGYSLGDFNVLTALDWIRNVYPDLNKNKVFPNKVIQLLRSSNPKIEPYETHNGVVVLEFKELDEILVEITQWIEDEIQIVKDEDSDFDEYNNYFITGDEEFIDSFISESEFRDAVLQMVKTEKHKIINGFLALFQKVMEKSWERTRPNKAFYAYSFHLNLLLDIICAFDLEQFPPALFEAVVYQLNKVSYYVGNYYGQSFDALSTWRRRREEIPGKLSGEIKRVARLNNYYNILNLSWK